MIFKIFLYLYIPLYKGFRNTLPDPVHWNGYLLVVHVQYKEGSGFCFDLINIKSLIVAEKIG